MSSAAIREFRGFLLVHHNDNTICSLTCGGGYADAIAESDGPTLVVTVWKALCRGMVCL